MKSFRYQFIDIDSSVTISNTSSTIKGYMVVRAPKGTTEAQYFAPGSEIAINSMIGLQTANWPDIYEAIQFNQQYGLYISAPPGTSDDYPSYYGGVYLTTKGQFPFWREQDMDNLSYTIQLYPGTESAQYDSSCNNSEIGIYKLNSKTGEQSIIQLTNVSASLMQKISYLTFQLWADSSTGIEDKTEVQYHLSNGKIYAVVDDVDYSTAVGYYELISDGTYTIVLGATGKTTVGGVETYIAATNTSSTTGVPFLDFTKLIDYTTIATDGDISGIHSPTGSEVKDSKDATLTGAALINYYILNGSSSKVQLLNSDGTVSTWIPAFTGLVDRIYYNVNLKTETFLALAQKSPNETPTSITISNIGYDKYKYDLNVPYMLESELKSLRADKFDISKYSDGKFLGKLFAANADGLLLGINTTATDTTDTNGEWTGTVSEKMMTLWQYSTVYGTWEDVTSKYITKTIYVESPLMDSNGKAYSSNTTVDAGCKNTLWYIESAGKSGKYSNKVYKEVSGGTYEPVYDINFNTVTITCKEEVYPGEYKSGGTFTGSLSETGKDASGGNIYWPNILPTDTITFLDVIPVNTFITTAEKNSGASGIDCINTEGFFTGKRIVDPIGPAQDYDTFTVNGQRYCTYVNNSNVKKGMLGCAWVDGYTAIINSGLIECQSTDYDDAYVIMEPTGQETFKSKLMTLRTTYHDLSTVISPKIITAAECSAPSTITVAGRSKGTAQYIGEFKLYDSYTGKYWWCQPIGDIGAMLCRIIEKKLGGIAPAGTNDSNGLGGILGRAVLAAKWKFSDSALEILDAKGLNPITYDADHGLMMQSQKSTQDPSTLTDWSYLGHSMSFDLCKREIREKVMVPQAHKRISDYWFKIRTKQIQSILDKRTTGQDPIWAKATVDITGQNNGTTKAARKFMILVQCKVYTYSDYVVLMFENLSQDD